MSSRRALLAALVAATLVLPLLAACGDDSSGGMPTASSARRTPTGQSSDRAGSDPSAEYYSRLNDIFNDADQKLNQVQADFETQLAAAQNLPAQKDAITSYLTKFSEDVKSSIDGLRELSPPGDAASPHREFLSAADAVLTIVQDVKAQMDTAQTKEEADKILAAFASNAQDRIDVADRACRSLQAQAITVDPGVDLHCGQ